MDGACRDGARRRDRLGHRGAQGRKARFEGEKLDVYTWIQSAHGAASLRRYAIRRGETLLVVGATEWVYIDAERGRPVLLPEADLAHVALIAADDPELKALGIARPIRFSPGANLLGLKEA